MKICTKCEVDYPAPLEDHFNKKSDTKDGLQRHCKRCIAKFHKKHYKERTSYYKKKARKHNAEYRLRNLQFMIDYLKSHPCIDCDETDPIVLEFDHLSNKETNITTLVGKSYSLKKIELEINKCVVRCANCHRRKTAKQLDWYKNIVF